MKILFNDKILLSDIVKDNEPEDTYYIIRKSILSDIYEQLENITNKNKGEDNYGNRR